MFITVEMPCIGCMLLQQRSSSCCRDAVAPARILHHPTLLLPACSAPARCLSSVKCLACQLGCWCLNKESHGSQ